MSYKAKQRLLVLTGLMLFLDSSVSAGSATGNVSSIWARPDSPYVMFNLIPPIETTHRCNTSLRFSIDLSRFGGQASLNLLLTAKREELPVTVIGLNTCNPYHAENVKSLQLD